MKQHFKSIQNMAIHSKPIDLLRIVIATFMGIHGVTRILLRGVEGFGIFLNSVGFPAGYIFAILVTAFELIGSFLLIIKYKIKYVSSCFIFELLVGILLVHIHEGWFVVGAGRNGIEYSALLIACFTTVILEESGQHN
jgi:putative oxidoreductase